MDDRRRALQEILDLLKLEGWNSDEATEELQIKEPARKVALLRSNPILMVICLAAIATNFVLIGANHDLHAAREATLSVLHVYAPPGVENQLDPLAVNFFLTIDGDWIWGAKPGGGFGLDRLRGKPGFPKIEIEGRSILQLWEKGDNGRPILYGQTPISLDHPDGSSFYVEVRPLDRPEDSPARVVDTRLQISPITVGLKLEKGRKMDFASHETKPID